MELINTNLQKTLFSRKELRWLLVDIKDTSPDVRIKFRLVQDGWQSKFYAIAHVTYTSVVIIDERHNQLKFASLSDITQFTISKAFKKMPAHHHFDVPTK